MSRQAKPQPTFEEWLEGERASPDGRSEYVGGEVFARTGASAEHCAIVVNIASELRAQMKGRTCQVCANDMKVRIRPADAGKYPDLIARCGEHRFEDGHRDVLLNPSLIVEALADSTEAYDRGKKFAICRQIPSLREYLLVSQHQVLVELNSRGDDGRWTLSESAALTDSVTLPSVGCTLSLAEVYHKVAPQPA